MNLNERIKYYRKDLNLTQQELADLAGISLRALSNYEKGLREPSMEVIIRIAKALMIPVNKLEPQLEKSAELKYLFSGVKKLDLDLEGFSLRSIGRENIELEDQRGDEFKKITDLLKKFNYQVTEIKDNNIDKIEISTVEDGIIMTVEENKFINLGNQLLDEINESISLQIKQFIKRNK